MEIRIKNVQLMMDFVPALQELKTYKPNVRVGLGIIKTCNACFDILKKFENARHQILEEESLKDEKGKSIVKDNQFQFRDDMHKKEVEAKIAILAEQEVTVDIWPIPLSEVESIKEFKVELLERLINNKFLLEEVPKVANKPILKSVK